VITFGSLFSGIGGFDLGFERAGMQCKWQVEIDDFASKVLQKHWPGVHRERDIKECGKHNLEWVDVICGGFPCQPHSVTGKRKGSKDERDLWPEFLRVAYEIKPRVIVGENVPGLLSTAGGEFFRGILRDLANLGLAVEWHVVPASSVGAPHERKRLFIVAHDNCLGTQGLTEEQIQGFSEFSWCKDVGRVEDLPERSDLYPSKLCGGSDGVPDRTHRLRCLGNAVVPAVAELIGRKIMRAVT
jgi:DNA (cytosine-5)-methyltransferase 1